MLDPAIEKFFTERKEGWLKKNIKDGMSENEINELKCKCEKEFSLENWLPNAAKRAGQMSISTHPCTFSHPSARKNKNGNTTSVIAESKSDTDGLLRSGNVVVESDALGNAAALDVYQFLSIVVNDGKTVIDHIKQETDLGKALLSINSEDYDVLKSGLSAIAVSNENCITSSKIKQVYFPINDTYHQLSILSNSGIIYELRKRINELRFSDKVKKGREKRRNNEYSEDGYREIYNIATIGYGGTKPQNISALNSQNRGKAHLLISEPPELEKRDIQFPTKNFFKQSIRFYECRDPLERLHRVFITENPSMIPRQNTKTARDRCLSDILDIFLAKMIVLRSLSTNQFRDETSKLPEYQKIWLCHNRDNLRAEQGEWLKTLCEEIAHWISLAYKKMVENALILGEAERNHIKEFIESHKEVLL